MNTRLRIGACLVLGSGIFANAVADQVAQGRSVTIYNQNFAVVRESVPMDLHAGVNDVAYSNITYRVEPDSVIIRDSSTADRLRVMDQSYRNDPVSQERLLDVFTGQTIDFQVDDKRVKGRIVRSGYVPDDPNDPNPNQSQEASQPLIDVDGKLRFSLPGVPLFPSLPDDSVLRPRLEWKLLAQNAGRVNAELSYITKGLDWEAAYNVQSPENSDTGDIVGWVTITNQTGVSLDKMRVRLMAGDVHRATDEDNGQVRDGVVSSTTAGNDSGVKEKAFDEYHLYTLPTPVAIRDRETKQVEFLRVRGVRIKTSYVYDGAIIDPNYATEYGGGPIEQPDFGVSSSKKVSVVREIANTTANHLGIPIPMGKVRFYRTGDGNTEFTGEDTVAHTAKNEPLVFTTGAASDIVADRKQTNFHMDGSANTADESFTIALRNHKSVPVTVRVVEHLNRAYGWAITAKTTPFVKVDAHTIAFSVKIAPDSSQSVSYSAHYTW